MDEEHSDGFCPYFHRAVELVGARWTGVILRELLRGATRFTQIRDAIPDISDKMLAARLRQLEDEGLVERTVRPTTPVQVRYGLTDKGRDLQQAVDCLSDWAHTWLAGDTLSA